MNPLVVLAKLGDAVDVLLATVRALPGQTGAALAVRRFRRLGFAAAPATLILYLSAAGDVAVASDGRFARLAAFPSVAIVPDWPEKLLAARGPFLFEPVGVLYLLPQLALFVSLDTLLGVALAFLVMANVAMASRAISVGRACRRSAYGRLLGVLPAFAIGMTCCVPTFLLVLGAGAAAAVLPLFVPVRGYLFPLALGLMLASLLLSSRELATRHAGRARLRQRARIRAQ